LANKAISKAVDPPVNTPNKNEDELKNFCFSNNLSEVFELEESNRSFLETGL
jgi:hypothetical protein